MKQVGFIGAYDKKDLLINIGKALTLAGSRVLIIDATTTQRFRYVVPNVSQTPTPTYISEYNGVDVALGFMNYQGIMQYLGQNQLPYDIIMVDTDNIQTFASFGLMGYKDLYIATSYDAYDLNKMIEILRYVPQPIQVTKVVMSADLSNGQEQQLDRLLSTTKVIAKKEKVIITDKTEDRKAILQNQLVRNISYKKLSENYKSNLEYLTSLIAEGLIGQSEIKRVIRKF